MTIHQNLVPESKWSLKCPHPMTPEYLTVHNTANDASAKNEISYMVTNTSQTSFHFAVDDVEVWQGLLLTRNGWHAGDGANGTGNRKTIGIEICYSKSGGSRFTAAEKNAAQLIANLLIERNWGIERVKKHQDWSGKNCPQRTLELGWSRFLSLITSNMSTAPDPGVPEEPMNQLHAYLGVANDQEALARLKEHLGEFEGKCDWGNSQPARGGFLGSERRKVATLTQQLENATPNIPPGNPPLVNGKKHNGVVIATDAKGSITEYRYNYDPN